jgi:hypothetical protein
MMPQRTTKSRALAQRVNALFVLRVLCIPALSALKAVNSFFSFPERM